MTNQEISLKITKILKHDVDHYTRNHNDGDRFETRKRVYAETYLDFLNKFNENDKAEGKTEEKNKKQGVHKTASIPAGMSAGIFLDISKPHDAINGAEDWI